MDKITFVIMVLGLLCIVIALSGAGILSRVIARPIITLTRNILKIKDGNLDVYCSVKSDDEIGQLASGFNTMLDRIKELLKNIKNEQQKKREYELALMQAQIKPHFLYNTLDLIYILCEMERNNEAKGITKALADFYRVALSNGREIITLEEEIKNVRDYLIIQRMRYSDVFEFDIRVDEGINHCKIPKLLIQPLVENSIYHGLKPKDSFGKIIVEAFRLNSLVVIRVTDNGVGMEEEKLKELLSPDSGQNAKTSFGLGSIHERIKLYYGEEYGLTIKSRPGLGTEATVTMPETDRSEGNA